ncbi:hypothetical protein GH714_020909 [Hevea brasiliensis]|uniref:Clp R domain-containing protein n=1 Tax=Hevea brasiliensis TaxID=3981 RepID=A0A6A6MBS9_HEVBR|nr:hypothetical protein GH714_020909 [Hevea brasiliensis]
MSSGVVETPRNAPGKFTHKTNEAFVSAHEQAISAGHAQITPLHLAVALISDPCESLARQSLTLVGCPSITKIKSDSHLAVDQLILGLLEDSQIGDLLKAGIAATEVKSEVEKLRGKEGKKLESASGDTTFQALKTYGRDLVEQAGKLDPVIGRDEEIRRVVRILSRRTKNNPVLIGGLESVRLLW